MKLARAFESMEKQLPALRDYSVPIMAEQIGGRPRPLGTGWFFRIENHWFLVTARHVLCDLFPKGADLTRDKNDCDIIVPGVGGQRVHLSGKATMVARHDVGVLHLNNPELVRDRWTPVTMLDLLRDDDSPQGWYFLTGWPQQLYRTTSIGLASKSLQLVAPFGSHGRSFDPGEEILITLDRNDHRTLDGHPLSVPALQGISGAPAWRIVPDGSTSYEPRLAGIQTGYFEDGAVWIVHATRCGVLRFLIERQFPGMFSASERLVSQW